MGFLDDDDLLDDDFDTSDIVPEFNAEYTHLINDPDMSVSLLAKVLGAHKVNKVNLLRKKINAMFDIFSDITLKDELNKKDFGAVTARVEVIENGIITISIKDH